MNMLKYSDLTSSDELHLGKERVIAETALVDKCKLGEFTEIAKDVNITESSLGDYSYVMERCEIIYANIGKFVNIASDVRINPGNHPMEWVSQHHFLYRMKRYGFRDHDNQEFFQWRKLQDITIGHDVWVGHKSIIMPGVTVGNGAIIGAGSIVTHDVTPYSVVVGGPSKKIRMRFPEKIWKEIEATAWWDWDHETIKQRLDDFRDIRKFLTLYGSNK